MSPEVPKTPVQEMRVISGGVSLAVYSRGDASRPTIILVHGYPDCARVWSSVAERLAGSFHVVTYDVRGAGASEIPERTSGYRLDLLSRDLVAVADAVCPGNPFHLVGHDWGSIQSWESATEPGLQSRIASFTTISGPCLDHAGMWFQKKLLRPTPGNIFQFLGQLVRSWYIAMFQLPFLPELIWRFLGPRWAKTLARTEGIRVESSPTQTSDGRNGVRLYRANFIPRLISPRKRYATMPVFLIVPLLDRFVSTTLFDELSEWAPNLRRQDVRAMHWLPLSKPEQLAALLKQFIESVQSGEACGEIIAQAGSC